MRSEIVVLTSFLTVFSASGLLEAATCPLPPSKIVQTVTSDVHFDQAIGAYRYRYTIHNRESSQLPIELVLLKLDSKPEELVSPEYWRASWKTRAERTSHVLWSTNKFEMKPEYLVRGQSITKFPPLLYSIKPGRKLDGFEVVSKRKPGLARVFLGGEVGDAPRASQGEDPDDVQCPGYFDGPLSNDLVVGVVVAPASEKYTSVSILFRNDVDGADSDSMDPNSKPAKIHVVLKGDKDFDVSKIDASSVTFGRGKAKPIAVKSQEQKGSSHKAIVYTFDTAQVGIRCDRDAALFLEGTAGGKPFLGGAPIKQVPCGPGQEMPKPKKPDPSHEE